MKKAKEKSREETIRVLNRITKEVENDPEVAKKAEEDQRKNDEAARENIVFTI